MVPKLHAKGSSFKGLAAYLLHDKDRAKSSERVVWIETRNLATRDGDVAWRVMAATAMDQDRLKQQAAIKNTGRKSKDAVLHFTLSWHPDEKQALTPEEMRRAAFGAIRALGAEDRQALLIAHGDEEHPHLHVVVNRVSSEDGRMLSSSKEKLNLSRWAQSYEKERGQVFCDQRVINNAARDRDEYTRGKKDKARNVYEVEAPANDNRPQAQAVEETQRRKAAELAKRQREMEARHKGEWTRIEEAHRQRRAEIEREAKRRTAASVDGVRKEYRQSWESLFQEDRAEQRQFELREEKLLGRVQNALSAIDFGAILRAGDRRQAISDAFGVFADAGKRLEAIKREQDRRARELLATQRRAEEQARKRAEEQRQAELIRQRETFKAQRQQIILSQQMDQAKMRAQWMERGKDRTQAWEEYGKIKLQPLPQHLPAEPPRADRFERPRAIDRDGDRFDRKPDRRNRD